MCPLTLLAAPQDAADWGDPRNDDHLHHGGSSMGMLHAHQEGVFLGNSQRSAEMVRRRRTTQGSTKYLAKKLTREKKKKKEKRPFFPENFVFFSLLWVKTRGHKDKKDPFRAERFVCSLCFSAKVNG